jgi:hypothetical protein
MLEERGSLVPRRPGGSALAALPLLFASALRLSISGLKLGCPRLTTASGHLVATVASCTPQQFSPGNAPTWDGNAGDLGTFLLQEVLWVLSVAGDFMFNIFSDVFEGIGCLIVGSFNGAITFLQTSWSTAASSLTLFGPAAPLIAILIVGVGAIMLAWLIVWAVREFILGSTKTAEDEEAEIA